MSRVRKNCWRGMLRSLRNERAPHRLRHILEFEIEKLSTKTVSPGCRCKSVSVSFLSPLRPDPSGVRRSKAERIRNGSCRRNDALHQEREQEQAKECPCRPGRQLR